MDGYRMMQQVLRGHEAADIVIFGLQEYLDNCKKSLNPYTSMCKGGSVMDLVASKFLWRRNKVSSWRAGVDRSAKRRKIRRYNQAARVTPRMYAETLGDTTKRDRGCHIFSHYNTELRVFVNPWSRWHVQLLTSLSIDNNKQKNAKGKSFSQCGKGVNVMQLQATRGDEQIYLCALNTHLSFKMESVDRMQNLVDALDAIRGVRCDVVIFLGDFNSRLNCEVDPSRPAGRPPYDMQSAVGSQSTFTSVMDKFCTRDGCKLAHGGARSDEMTQFLTREIIDCYQKSDDAYSLQPFVNKFLKYNLREASEPLFPFSYKVKPSHKCAKYGITQARLLNGTCYVNKDGSHKHNPAWTDRILIRDSKELDVITQAYEQRPFILPKTLSSFLPDHTPVIAKFLVQPKTK